jgi:D-aspartate ligase
VFGDADLVRPIGLAGIPCAVPREPGAQLARSRFVRETFAWVDAAAEPERFVDVLAAFGGRCDEPPVVYCEADWELLAVSRHRDRLAPAVRVTVTRPELVEDLVDKSRFQRLAAALDLPVPEAARIDPATAGPDDVPVAFPLVVKPLTRHSGSWDEAAGGAKAVQADDAARLRELWPALTGEVLVQTLVPGPETLIESYHTYVDAAGEFAAEFTGRKIRTYPLRHGHSTAVEITEAGDVRALGRDIVRRLGLDGVAKLDFKRTADGGLRLLEVNPRFTLWHHLAAVAGLNIPAIVHADLTGRPRPPAGRARPGARWCHPLADNRARRDAGIPLRRWARWLAASDATSALSFDDPVPALAWALSRARAAARRGS